MTVNNELIGVLRRCPCGEAARRSVDTRTADLPLYAVGCSKCIVMTEWVTSEADAIAAWNRLAEALTVAVPKMNSIHDKLLTALRPLARIADAYDDSSLDEHRPEWDAKDPAEVELFAGRGGKRLLTLADAFAARSAIQRVEPVMQSDYTTWNIWVSGYGQFEFFGTEAEAEELRASKARHEGGRGEKWRADLTRESDRLTAEIVGHWSSGDGVPQSLLSRRRQALEAERGVA